MTSTISKALGDLLARDVHAGKTYYVKPTGSDLVRGTSWANALKTAQKAHDTAAAGDRIIVGPGDYDETLTITKDGLKFIGAGNLGDVSIAPTAANATAIVIDGTTASGRVEDVTLRNIGGAGIGSGGGLHAKGNIRRLRAYECKLEAEAGAAGFDARLESTVDGSVGDTLFHDCEFAWGDTALSLKVTGGGNAVTQTAIRRGKLHNFATRGIHVDTVATNDLWVYDDTNFFRKEDGTEPSDEYVLAAVAGSTGGIYGSRFPAVKATAKISLATNVIRTGNWFTDGHD